ncbi:unnamed protein product, partial [marine sediment metagenome]
PGSSDHKTRSDELTEMRIGFQVWAGVQDRRLKEWHKQWMFKIYTDLAAGAGKVAAERGIDLVLIREDVTQDAADSSELVQRLLLQKVLYYDGKLDITDRVLAVANEGFLKRGGPDSIKFGSAEVDDKLRLGTGAQMADAKR